MFPLQFADHRHGPCSLFLLLQLELKVPAESANFNLTVLFNLDNIVLSYFSLS